MKRVIVDASVVVQLFFPEEHSTAAERCFKQYAAGLEAPDLIWAETGNVLWKRRRRQELSAADAALIADKIFHLPLRICESRLVVPGALALAEQFDRTIYDCLYLALAQRSNGLMLTADRRLVNALAGTSIEKHIAWIGSRF